LAKKLNDAGYSQNEIASRLSITQAAVSKYLKQSDETSALVKDVDTLTTRMSDMMINDSPGPDLLVKEICSACMVSRIGGGVCDLHRERIPSLGQVKCQICNDLLGRASPLFSTRALVLRDMDEALSILSNIDGFEKVMPQVRANLVMCSDDAEDLSEVASVPGRITLVAGKARAAAVPQFGTSKHMASLLLWAKHIWSEFKSCLCISGAETVVQATLKSGFKGRLFRIKETGGDAASISKAIELELGEKKRDYALAAFLIPGGIGIEPILYIFGSSASFLAEVAKRICSKL
jgi:predicted fused transcriptional regulator/phosphomethylpyrimidine kinase/predicted transcriptional regulator